MMGSVGNHSAFIKSDGSLWTMGKNDEGQLANWSNTDLNTPAIVSLGSFAVSLGSVSNAAFDFAKVAIGGGHTIYVSTEGNGALNYGYTSGSNTKGQLGDGTTNSRNNFQLAQTYLLNFGGRVVDAAAGYNFSLFLMDDGSLLGSGDNFRGQLGLGHENNQSTLQTIMSSGVRQVAAGGMHTLIVKTDGSLWGMGRNDIGQLGLGDQVNRKIPEQILASGVDQVAAGVRYSLIIKTDGSLWGMGDSSFGQLGTGTSGPELLPVQLEASGVTQVSSGSIGFQLIKINRP